jgi:hypothetical protein
MGWKSHCKKKKKRVAKEAILSVRQRSISGGIGDRPVEIRTGYRQVQNRRIIAELIWIKKRYERFETG